MKILVFLDFFTPAYKAGGPIRIFEALARSATPERQVGIVSQNTDWGDAEPLSVKEGTWLPFERARAIYLAPEHRRSVDIRALIDDFGADAIHLNSLFSRTWTMKVLVQRFLGHVRAPVFSFAARRTRVFSSRDQERTKAALSHRCKNTRFVSWPRLGSRRARKRSKKFALASAQRLESSTCRPRCRSRLYIRLSKKLPASFDLFSWPD